MPVTNVTLNNSSSTSGGLQGTWNASTNTPTLANTDTGKISFMYQVSTGGTVNFGAGAITFEAKDIVVNNGTTWDKIDSTDAVVSVNGNNGVVVLDADDIGDGTTNKAFTATEKTKLTGIETGATADQTAGEIKTAYETNANTNAYTDTEKTKLAGIATGAEVNTVDSVNTQTGVVVLDADDISDTLTTKKFTNATDISKLSNIEANATANPNAFDKTADDLDDITEGLTNKAFTSTLKTKLDNIEASAQVNTVTSVASKTGAVSLVKGDVGLANVDNTADTAKPVSTVQQTALNLKANIASPTFTGTVSGVTKAHVGLSNVDNTSDVNKPVSSATQTALNGKVDVDGVKVLSDNNYTTAEQSKVANIPANTNTELGNKQNLDSSLTEISGLFFSENDLLQYKTGVLAKQTPSQVKTTLGLVKADVGLGNVANTSDANKPVSSATQTALNLKANLASPTFTGTVSGVTATHVGLGNVANVDTTNASNISSGTLSATRLPTAIDAANIADGTISNAEFQYLNGVTSNIQTQIDGLGGFWDEENAISTAQSMTSSTTYVDLTGMSTTLLADSTYLIEIDFFGYRTNTGAPYSVPSLKLSYSGTTYSSNIAGSEGATMRIITINGTANGVYDTNESGMTFKGSIVTNTTGTLKLQFAQSEVDVDAVYVTPPTGFRIKKVV